METDCDALHTLRKLRASHVETWSDLAQDGAATIELRSVVPCTATNTTVEISEVAIVCQLEIRQLDVCHFLSPNSQVVLENEPQV